MTADLARDTIFVTVAGSHAQGFARAESDVDLHGICVVPLAERLSLFRNFEQWSGVVPEPLRAKVDAALAEHPSTRHAADAKHECLVFEVAKFLRLCASANPNALELLFADPRDWLLTTPAFERIHGQRHRFLTKQVGQTFAGYAKSQLRRIGTHRSWLLNPPAEKPRREDFGLPGTGTLAREDRDAIEQELVVPGMQLPAEVLAVLRAERSYRAAMRHYDAYETWKATRNPARAALERTHGYDTKHAMHLVRLLLTGIEVLETGDLQTRRRDVERLAAIRDGAWTFDELLAEVEKLDARCAVALASSTLPEAADRQFVDDLAVRTMLAFR